jgi:hypothetical protein
VGKKYDPLWELVGLKVPLQGAEPDVDARCPNCHVTVHIGLDAKPGDKVECGLCGEPLVIVTEDSGLVLGKDEEAA